MPHASQRLPGIPQSDKLRANSERARAPSALIGALHLAKQQLHWYVGRLQQWMLPRSRMLLVGLIGTNLAVAASLTLLNQDQIPPNEQVLASSQDADSMRAGTVEQAARPQPISPAIKKLQEPVEPHTALNESATANDERVCRVWGPERNEEAFTVLIDELDAVGGFPETQKKIVQGTPDYLVYIDDLGSRGNAKRVASELESVKTDSYLIIAEDGRPILSVGVFSRQALADRQYKRMQSLGYKVGLQTVERTQVVYNLTAHVPIDSEAYETSTSSCVAIAQGS